MTPDYAIRGGILPPQIRGSRGASPWQEVQEDGVLLPRSLEILIGEGRILEVAPKVDPEAPTLDAAGLWVLPGAIDAHVHFRDPGHPLKETWETGSAAALAGGVTTVLDMPNTQPPTITLEALESKRAAALARSSVNVGLFFGLTDSNVEEALRAQEVAGLKAYLGSSTGGLLVREDATLRRVFEEYSGVVVIHAEAEGCLCHDPDATAADHGRLRPTEAAVVAVRRALGLLEESPRRARLHVAHASTPEELGLIERAKSLGLPVTCEVAPHHLLLDQERVHDNLLKVNPPLRSRAQRLALGDFVRRGVVDILATDHAPHTLEEKSRPYASAPSGMPSVELLYPLVFRIAEELSLPPELLIQLVTRNPARVFGLAGKGRVEAGADADLALVDPGAAFTVERSAVISRCGWSPYEGWRLPARVITTIVGGRVHGRSLNP